MTELSRRCTVYLGPEIHRALRLMSAETGRSVSEYVNEAVRAQLAEDAEDLAALEARADGPAMTYPEYLEELGRRGKL